MLTHVRAVQEFGIAIREIVALFRTTFTCFGTCATDIRVSRRFDEHQARAGLAQLGTLQEQRRNMRLGGRFITTKVRDDHQTGAMTIQTILDALVHFHRHFIAVMRNIHGNRPLYFLVVC